MLRLGLIILTLCLPLAPERPAFKYGTTIVAIRTPNEVAVAADSRIMYSDGSPPSDTACKIHRSEGIYFAIAGVSEEKSLRYDSAKLVSDILKEKGQLSDKINIIEKRIQEEWERLLPLVQQKERAWYMQHMMNRSFWAVVVFGADGTATYMHTRSIQETKPWAGKVYINSRNDCTDSCELVTILGVNRSLESYVARHSPNMRTQDISGIAQAMMQAEVDLRSPDVGGPIDVLRIGKNRQAEWKQRKQQCSE